MKHKFTVVIESNDDSEDREVVKDCLQDWLPSEQAARQHLALMQLHQLRDCYRQGWVPAWKSREENTV